LYEWRFLKIFLDLWIRKFLPNIVKYQKVKIGLLKMLPKYVTLCALTIDQIIKKIVVMLNRSRNKY
jgi:hypothetical protein